MLKQIVKRYLATRRATNGTCYQTNIVEASLNKAMPFTPKAGWYTVAMWMQA
jgi:hypothetical protein